MPLTVEFVANILRASGVASVVEDEVIESVLEELRNRPKDYKEACQPYKVKKRGKRSAS
jgi:hypothetical protein